MATNGHDPRAWVLLNPHSGAVRSHPRLLSELRRVGGDQVRVLATQDVDELRDVCEQAAAGGVRRIGCVGGDGSASAVTTAVARAYGGAPLPSLALLRGGTMNTVASCLGVPHLPTTWLLRRWLRRPTRNRERAPLQVGDTLGFLFGVGLFPNWLAAYYQAGHGHPTPRTAARMTLQTALSTLCGGGLGKRVLAPVQAEIETDGEHWEAKAYYSVMAGAVDQVGLNFRVFPHASEDPQRVDLIALRSPGWKLALAMPEMWIKRSGLPRSIHDERLVEHAVLQPTHGPLLYALDGDLRRSEEPLTLRRGPLLPIADLS